MPGILLAASATSGPNGHMGVMASSIAKRCMKTISKASLGHTKLPFIRKNTMRDALGLKHRVPLVELLTSFILQAKSSHNSLLVLVVLPRAAVPFA